MKTEILLFASQFVTVFALGFQQQNVHRRAYGAAATTSLLIGIAQAFLWRKMPEASVSEMTAWLAAGPVAIVVSMWIHPRIFKA